jgi:lysophospholipase L1-like esterase
LRQSFKFPSVTAALVLVCASFIAACGNGPTKPTETSVAPDISCPAAPEPTVSPNGSTALVVYGDPSVAGGKIPLLTNCTPVSGASFPIGTNTVTCTTTDALNRTDSCTFDVVVAPSPTIAMTRFVAFGDSITLGQDGINIAPLFGDRVPHAFQPFVVLPLTEQYPEQLRVKLAARYPTQQFEVKNEGRGLAEPNRDEVARFAEVIPGYQAVLLMEGANSLSDIRGSINNLRRMLQEGKARNIRPYIATIPPEDPIGWRRPDPDHQVPVLNEEIKLLALQEGVTLVDVFAAFPPGDLIAQGLIAQGLLGSDGLHPTSAGYGVIAEAFFQKLKETLENPQ